MSKKNQYIFFFFVLLIAIEPMHRSIGKLKIFKVSSEWRTYIWLKQSNAEIIREGNINDIYLRMDTHILS